MEELYYVYVLSREDGTPFYVGYGKGDRWLDHELERTLRRKRSNPHKNRIIRKILDAGLKVPKRKIAEGLTKKEAINLEIATILEFGRIPNGPLVNLTPGGDGVREWSPEARMKIAESSRNRGLINGFLSRMRRIDLFLPKISVPKSDTHKAKIRDAAIKRTVEGRNTHFIGRPHTEATKAKLTQQNRARAADPKERAKISAALRGRTITEETREKMRLAQQKRQREKRENG